MYDTIMNFIPFVSIIAIVAYIVSFVIVTKTIQKFKKRKPNGRHIYETKTVSLRAYTRESLKY